MSTTRMTRRIAAPPDRVYRALTDPDAVARWMVPDGMTSRIHAYDASEGGTFRISLTYDTPDSAGKTSAHSDTYHGRFVELVPGRRVVQAVEFETADPDMQGEMRVSFDLSGAGEGTELHALHEGVPPGIAPGDNETGWRMSLDKLCALVEAPD
jgi:uncharacterized protein YndB with AHSA1/START domain